jgi:hypothetical protein
LNLSLQPGQVHKYLPQPAAHQLGHERCTTYQHRASSLYVCRNSTVCLKKNSRSTLCSSGSSSLHQPTLTRPVVSCRTQPCASRELVLSCMMSSKQSRRRADKLSQHRGESQQCGCTYCNGQHAGSNTQDISTILTRLHPCTWRSSLAKTKIQVNHTWKAQIHRWQW